MPGLAARTKPCPCAGCTVQCGRGHLMCREHWMRVPGKMRRQVNRAWREYLALLRSVPRDKTELLMQARAYQDAADAAVLVAGG